MTTVGVKTVHSARLTGTGDGSSVNVDDSVVPQGFYRKYLRVGVVNEDNNSDSITIKIMKGAVEHRMAYKHSPSDGQLYWDPDPILLTEGEYLRVTFQTTVASDSLLVYTRGIEGPIGEVD